MSGGQGGTTGPALADGWITWLRGGPPFSADEQARFERRQVEGNAGRLRVLLPLLALAQAAVAVQLLGQQADGPAQALHLRALTVAYALSAGAHAVVAALQRYGPERVQRELPTIAACTYFLHVSAVVAAEQLGQPALPLLFWAGVGAAILIALPPSRVLVAYGVLLAGVAGAVLGFQADPEAQVRLLRVGAGMWAFAAALALFLHGARRRDYLQQRTIERQQEQLEQLNQQLEGRVAEQVRALTRRADEVERLNAQLQAQVRDRSRALTLAMRKLVERDLGAGDLQGQLLDGRFSVGPLIASGGMGAVYEGIVVATGEPVAVKVIRTAGQAPASLLQRFLREAESAASVDHPAVVRMLHVDVHDDGTFYQVQELVRGETLHDAIRRHGRFTPAATCRVLAVLVDALAAAHARGVVHRDVKPANIMLTRHPPGLKLLDFGISKLRESTNAEGDAAGEAGATLFEEGPEVARPGPGAPGAAPTRLGAVLGTPQYMSPEQRVDAGSATARADLFAVGVVAAELLGAAFPEPGQKDAFAGAGLPGPVEGPLTRCLALDARDRPTAAELAPLLTGAADDAGVPLLHELVRWDGLRVDTGVSTDETLYG